ncbi:unnamed protein product [Caenorhabditis auriculariae]|uniref:Uncharacterized protein n=1 Tax=Caenorhabditis auriculariae TaxID=2777116 RepID=A0A8S1GX19_9PELO|nr:unnamed protein product [Caenorhabditis auriculariae]
MGDHSNTLGTSHSPPPWPPGSHHHQIPREVVLNSPRTSFSCPSPYSSLCLSVLAAAPSARMCFALLDVNHASSTILNPSDQCKTCDDS